LAVTGTDRMAPVLSVTFTVVSTTSDVLLVTFVLLTSTTTTGANTGSNVAFTSTHTRSSTVVSGVKVLPFTTAERTPARPVELKSTRNRAGKEDADCSVRLVNCTIPRTDSALSWPPSVTSHDEAVTVTTLDCMKLPY